MQRRDRRVVPVIHAITNEEVLTAPGFLDRARAVMEALGARGAVHLRGAGITASLLHALAEKLAEAQRATESWLIVNDRIDLALIVGARGVQLTSRSIGVSDALSITRGMPLGASVHSVDDAIRAERDGAAWIVAGHVYQTASHAGDAGRGESFVSEVAWRVTAPVIAIGGIQPGNVRDVRNAGAHGVAVIRGIWSAPSAAIAAHDYLSRYDADGDQ